ncbi:hypothetical protein, partial [Waddlia chondrophila]|uniref:hypothetical protein n=1 Tax=Waddlia chondrophila TaxID=71667 RepID=UPI001B8038D4
VESRGLGDVYKRQHLELLMAIINDLAADFKAAYTGNSNFKNAGNLSTACQWGKVATVALIVATVASALFSGPVGLFVMGLTALALFDCYRMLDNVQHIADRNVGGRLLSEASDFAQSIKPHEKIVRGTIFARPIANLIA